MQTISAPLDFGSTWKCIGIIFMDGWVYTNCNVSYLHTSIASFEGASNCLQLQLPFSQPAAGVTCMLIGDSAIGHRRSIDGGTTARSFNQLAHFTGRQRASTHGDFRRRQQIDFPAYSSIASWHGSESSSQTAAPVS